MISRTVKILVLTALCVHFLGPLAMASDHDLIGLPRPEFADLVGRAQEADKLKATVETLQAALEAAQTRDRLRAEVVAVKDEMLAVQADLLRLEKERAAYWQARAGEADRRGRGAGIQGTATMVGCGLGLLATPFAPGISTIAGCAAGAGVGEFLKRLWP